MLALASVSQEAITLAGHLALSRLIVVWDDNGISIDGPLGLTDSTDQKARFAAAGWAVTEVDGHDHAAVDEAFTWAKGRFYEMMGWDSQTGVPKQSCLEQLKLSKLLATLEDK